MIVELTRYERRRGSISHRIIGDDRALSRRNRLVRAYVVSRHRLGLEVAALRQQLVVFKRKRRGLYCVTSTDSFGLRSGAGGPAGPLPW